MLRSNCSWSFSKLLSDLATRLLVAIWLALVTFRFVTSGLGLFLQSRWWRQVAAAAAGFSSIIFLLSWDGKLQALDDKGGIGLLINLVVLGVVVILKWPALVLPLQ
jgi:hypothetical protein